LPVRNIHADGPAIFVRQSHEPEADRFVTSRGLEEENVERTCGFHAWVGGSAQEHRMRGILLTGCNNGVGIALVG
jgi:hypothetical protein